MNTSIYIALGSNVGDRIANLGKAILLLAQHQQITIRALSSIYETDPVGYLNQDAFYNMVIEVDSNLRAVELMRLCLDIEQQLGRVRTVVNGPRTIDLDLLYYGEKVLEEDILTLPHPRLHERAFVLVPLTEIAPHFRHPTLLEENKMLLSRIPMEGVRKLSAN